MNIQTKRFEIMFKNAEYAYFEHNKMGDDYAGGLWFNLKGELIDYDGVYELPNEIIEALQNKGYNMDYAIID